MSTLPFRYRTISQELIHEMGVHLGQGRSLVVVGAPNAGKGYVARKVAEWLKARNYTPVVRVNFRGAAQNPKEQLDRALQAAGLPTQEGEHIFSSLDLQESAFLFMANPDGLPRGAARKMLQGLRERIGTGKIMAMVRGEQDLNELVHGPGSEFNIAQPYVLQNFDITEFTEYLKGYGDELHLSLTPEALKHLWEQTGGVGDQLKVVLTALVERRVLPKWYDELAGTPGKPVTTEEIEGVIERLPNLNVPHRILLRHADTLLTHEQELRVFDNLSLLLEKGVAPLDQPAGPPDALTLSGLATRKDGALHFSSPLIERAARHYFTPSRIVYFHAEAGRFRQAFSCAELEGAAPSWDPSILTGPVRAAAAEVHREGAEGRRTVWRFFEKICHALLGLREVSFWEFRTKWSPVSSSISEQMRQAALDALKLKCDDPEGGILVPTARGAVFGWYLDGLSKDWKFAVFAGDPKERADPPKPVAALVRDFGKQFVEAHNRAVQREEAQRQQEFLLAMDRAMQHLEEKFARDVPDLNEILKEADGLRALGYRRIGFSLIDPWDGKLHRVYDSVDESTVPLMKYGPWKLDEPDNINAYVAAYQKSMVIEDAKKNKMVTPAAVEEGGLEAFALCPIVGLSRTLGTIHFERLDRKRPSLEEVEDFERLGKNLGLLIEQSWRLQLLQRAIDHSREATMICNNRSELIFANRQAGELFGLRPGWKSENRDSESKAKLMEIAANVYRSDASRPKGSTARRVELHQPFPGTNTAVSIQADVLLGWRGNPAASSLGALDLTEDYDIFRAFEILSKASDLDSGLRTILDAVRALRYPGARIYILKGGELISKYQYGFEGKAKTVFETLNIPLTGRHTWRCLEEQRLIVFRFHESEECKDHTELGLEVEQITETNPGIIQKRRDDYWIDAPLFADGKKLGKISIDCARDIRPERVEFLRAFLGLVCRLLEALSRAGQQAFQMSMAELSHNLYTQVTWLDTQCAIYREHERVWRPDLLRVANDRLEAGFRRVSESLARAKDSYSVKPPQHNKFDLLQLIREVLPSTADIDTAMKRVEVVADQGYLVAAMKEILVNSESFQPTGLRLWVRLREHIAGGEPWIEWDIEDNGPGFPKEINNERAFENFTTSRSVDQPPGTGLGLAIAKRRIELHGGTVGIAAGQHGSGACIRIRIPKDSSSVALAGTHRQGER